MIKSNKGFTLVEVMIAISLIGVILIIISNMLNYNINNLSKTNRYYKYKLDARYAMNKVTHEIKKEYGTSFDSGKIKASDSSILINSTSNEVDGNIYLYYDADRYGTGDGYGELRYLNGQVIVENIKEFKLENEDTNLVKVTVKTGRENTGKMFELVTYVRLYN